MPVRSSKVPSATASFWLAKAVTTALGEAASDFLVRTINPELAVLLGFAGFVVALGAQLRRDDFVPWVYWSAVAMVGVFGTMAADVLHVALGVPYLLSAPLFAVSLAAVFVAWHRSEGTLSIHSVTTRRREVFYWLAVIATFALGTATGDLTAVTFRWGYFPAGAVFAGLIAVVFAAHRLAGLNAVVGFWTAYVLTRPLGASFADGFGQPPQRGGIGLGSGVVTVLLVGVLAVIVAFLQRSADRASARRGRQPAASRGREVNAGNLLADGVE